MIYITLHLSHSKHWILAHCRQKYEFVDLLNDFDKTHCNDIGVNDNSKSDRFVIPPQRKILHVTNLEFLHNVLDFNPWDFSTWQLRPVQICPHAYQSIDQVIVFSGVSSFPASHCTGFKGSENTVSGAFQVMKDGLKYLIYCKLFCVT